MKFSSKNSGLTLIELVIAIALFGLIGLALFGMMIFVQRGSNIVNQRSRAQELVKEGQDVVSSIRDKQGWLNFSLTADGSYCLDNSSGSWRLTTTGQCQNCVVPSASFWRCVQLTTLSAAQKKVNVTVGYDESGTTRSVNATTILGNWR